MKCPCGLPLHYADPEVEAQVQALVDDHGETVDVTTPDGTWPVPRHYIALHGIKAEQLPDLAFRYGWRRVEPSAQIAGEPPPGRSGTENRPTAENGGESRLDGAP